MTQVERWHDEAMEAVDAAFLAGRRGHHDDARKIWRRALELERKAAMALVLKFDAEPSRAILFRSAATIAIDAGELGAAEELVAGGLMSPMVAPALREELRALYEEIRFRAHLDAGGLALEPGEMAMFMLGDGIGRGMAPADAVTTRIDATETMLVRLAERRAGKKFRERGSPDPHSLGVAELFMSAGEASSFVVRMRVGRPQGALFHNGQNYGQELLHCLAAFEKDDEPALQQLIPLDAYRRNFTALGRKLAPDGESVTTVGLSGTFGDFKPSVVLRKVRRGKREAGEDEGERSVELTGELQYADSTKTRPAIKLVDDHGAEHKIGVPDGMMNDIVRPNYGLRVTVRAAKKKGKLRLLAVDAPK